ncbi:uncharacterized protein TrAtP1_009733 [Trichoderma atroviride]|uniref:Protein kinase domain-containing protein n=1 Tax=Hypocrea atroviridis (strain ATCC 20476 / IMI 206040) TaxID=452589 RepID=G9NKT8_HYPAI|nr:uncharacterized protein TRIATDRAFT_315758 [Trichoderma atroviride IMI 206040]EHK48510.1 hypothetical protein TRIATDRAFT_315758 [Trichoderma atroviride IMI 206040]UKZ68710.1 hypothetical protein TrAtP1_009733 [Trichoderma atroviride]
MAAASSSPPREIPFATFTAANDAAVLLLELIQTKASPPTLISSGNTIGYHIPLPLLSDTSTSHDNGSGSASDSQANSQSYKLVRWKIGAGASPTLAEKGLGYTNPDILLCAPGDTPASHRIRNYIKDFHAYITFHPTSGVLRLMTVCDRPVIYEQGDMHDNDLTLRLDEWGKAMTCVLRRERNYLRFGPYRFLFNFVTQTRQNFDRFTTHMNEVIKSDFHGLNPSRLFNFIPMPSPYHETSWNIWLHHKIPTTNVITGVDIHTGQPVAVKKLLNKEASKTRQYVVERLKMALQSRDAQDSGILGIIDIWCSHQTSPPCLFDASNTEMLDECQYTFYSMPLAGYSFLNFPWTKLEADTRLAYFHQTLLGLSALHEQGLVHGNIRPSSLLVLANTTHKLYTTTTALSTKMAVLSLSMSQTERKLHDTTRICIAPEAWEKINSRSTTDLDKAKLDIWALATSWLYTFMRPPDNFKIVAKRDYLQMQGQVQYRIKRLSSLGPFAPLLNQMLAWEPEQRPSAAEALASTAWQPVWDEKRRKEDKMKQKRKAKAQSDGTKRVRVLSPGTEDYQTIESDSKQD